jgi:hypothetical protein
MSKKNALKIVLDSARWMLDSAIVTNVTIRDDFVTR